MAATPEALFAAVVEDAPSRPFVTFYDEDTGERSELSAKSLANWVAKTHFLLTDELGLGVGDAAFVDLPAHWISLAPLLGCWTAGLEITTESARAAVAFVTADSTLDTVPDRYAIAPQAAARGLAGQPPDGVSDYVAAIRPQPDKWATVRPPASPADPAIDRTSRSDVVAKALVRAGELGLAPGARLLTTKTWRHPDDWIDDLLAPAAVGGSIVIVRGASPDTVARRAEQERATTVV
jgi:uncharacterized protein (TIGR03089 family)